MKCDFIVGQKVVCVGGFPDREIQRAKEDGVYLPAKGAIYTIRDMEPGADWWTRHLVFIRLVELVNTPHVVDGIEPSFSAGGFRPVVEKKADISIFTAMLAPAGRLPVDA